jgi:predicted Rossmann-fold nucleotide-binding protein
LYLLCFTSWRSSLSCACRCVYYNLQFFSSARGRSSKQIAEQRHKHQAVFANTSTSHVDKEAAAKKLAQLDAVEWMCPFYDGVSELAAKITRWAMERHPDPNDKHFVVATGGGPGLMEAANKGAASVAADRSCGMGITLPFEPGLNPYVTTELAFEFHYFFM